MTESEREKSAMDLFRRRVLGFKKQAGMESMGDEEFVAMVTSLVRDGTISIVVSIGDDGEQVWRMKMADRPYVH